MKSDVHLLVDIALATGLQWGELNALRRGDVTFPDEQTARVLVVRARSQHAPEKGTPIKPRGQGKQHMEARPTEVPGAHVTSWPGVKTPVGCAARSRTHRTTTCSPRRRAIQGAIRTFSQTGLLHGVCERLTQTSRSSAPKPRRRTYLADHLSGRDLSRHYSGVCEVDRQTGSTRPCNETWRRGPTTSAWRSDSSPRPVGVAPPACDSPR